MIIYKICMYKLGVIILKIIFFNKFIIIKIKIYNKMINNIIPITYIKIKNIKKNSKILENF